MTLTDWIVVAGTLLLIVGYGAWKTRKNDSISGFLKGDNQQNWWTIGLSIMATQASAITFLSTPGQAFESGMGFVQFYFGLPIAAVIISAVFIPIYYKLNVYTAYEYLESRFGLPTRLFTAMLFLISRGLAAGITIYAPAIILSTLLGWNLYLTNILVGVLVIVYVVSGGTRAVSLTQKWQMGVIMGGMFLAFGLIISYLPDELDFGEAVNLAGEMGKMEIVDTSFNLENRYTLWTGLLGGFFLALSYFGTDQSQVQRYLGGKSVAESRFGLLFNGLLKVPMQLFILFVGIMVFVFFQFNEPPAFFNRPGMKEALQTEHAQKIKDLESEYSSLYSEKETALTTYMLEEGSEKEQALEKAKNIQNQSDEVRSELKQTLKKADPLIETKDTDYVFLTFILGYMPQGVVGLLLAVILSAAMSSTAGEINALCSTTMVDYYKRLSGKTSSEVNEVRMSRLFTLIWGILAITVALSASLFENLIQLVNLLGSLFYGTILGIFLVAFFLKKIGGKPTLWAGILGEIVVLTCHFLTVYEVIEIGYLWYNLIGCGAVIIFAVLFNQIFPSDERPKVQHQ
jgi:Na+/proline symporter